MPSTWSVSLPCAPVDGIHCTTVFAETGNRAAAYPDWHHGRKAAPAGRGERLSRQLCRGLTRGGSDAIRPTKTYLRFAAVRSTESLAMKVAPHQLVPNPPGL